MFDIWIEMKENMLFFFYEVINGTSQPKMLQTCMLSILKAVLIRARYDS